MLAKKFDKIPGYSFFNVSFVVARIGPKRVPLPPQNFNTHGNGGRHAYVLEELYYARDVDAVKRALLEKYGKINIIVHGMKTGETRFPRTEYFWVSGSSRFRNHDSGWKSLEDLVKQMEGHEVVEIPRLLMQAFNLKPADMVRMVTCPDGGYDVGKIEALWILFTTQCGYWGDFSLGYNSSGYYPDSLKSGKIIVLEEGAR